MTEIAYKKNAREFMIFTLCFAATYLGVVLFLWPGLIRPDSLNQLNQALTGVMTDHHPPIMGLYWRILHYVYAGSGPLFLTHISLLFGGLYLFAKSVRNSHWIWFYLGLVFWPQIAFYAPFIVKDIGFTFSFLFTAGALTYYSTRQEYTPLWVVGLLSVILFYGTGVKYQAMFILPIMCIWMSFQMKGLTAKLSKILRGLVMFGLIYGATQMVNNIYVSKQDHAWQYVKLFDLAGMSIKTNTDLIPEVAKVDPKLSLDELKQIFNPERVDEMVFSSTPLLKKETMRRSAILFGTPGSKLLRQIPWLTWNIGGSY